MEFYRRLKRKAGNFIDVVKESVKTDKLNLVRKNQEISNTAFNLKNRIAELENILLFKQQEIKIRGQNIRQLQSDLENSKKGMIPEELLKTTLKGIPIPLIYTGQDFIIVGHSYGTRDYFERGLVGTRYGSLFVDQEQFKEYAEKAGDLQISKSLEMDIELRNRGNVYSRTTSLYLGKQTNPGFMIYIEPPAPEMDEEEKVRFRDRIKSLVTGLIGKKPKVNPKPAPQN